MKKWSLACIALGILALGVYTVHAAEVPNPFEPKYHGQCTWWAAEMRPDLRFNIHSANTWVPTSQAQGYAVDTTPEIGAIVFFSPGIQRAGSVGHLGYVDSVTDKTHFHITEYNFPQPEFTLSYHERSMVWENGIQFIHTKGYNPNPPPVDPNQEKQQTLSLSFQSLLPLRNIQVESGSKFQLKIDGQLKLSADRPAQWSTFSLSRVWVGFSTQHSVEIIWWQRGSESAPKFTQTWWPNSIANAAELEPGLDDTLPISYTTVIQPNPGIKGQPVQITIAATSDWGYNISTIDMFINGTSVGTINGASGTYTWNTADWDPGTYQLSFWARVDQWGGAVSNRSLNFDLLREDGGANPGCNNISIEDLSFSPSSPSPMGTSINIHAKSTWNNCFRSMRLKIDGIVFYEVSSSEFTYSWKTTGLNAGNHSVRLEVATIDDTDWTNPSSREAVYALEGNAPQPTTTCSAPPIEDLTFNPSSATIGTIVKIHAKATWNDCFRAMRLKIDSDVVYELGSSEFTYTWNTQGESAGAHSIRLEVAAKDDNNWSYPTFRDETYALNTEAPQSTPIRSCSAPPIEDLSFTPSSPATVGTTVKIHAKATWNDCFRAMRLKIDNEIVYELGSPEFTFNWNTNGEGTTNHPIRVEVAAKGDDSWLSPSSRNATYTLQAGNPQPTPSCIAPAIEELSFSPGSPATIGTTVNIHAKATWNNCFRSMRVKIDGNVIYELGTSEFTYGWNTSGYSAGNHTIRLEVAAQGDDRWSNPTSSEKIYTLQPGEPPTPIPCTAPPIEDLSINPGSATVGATVNIHAKATWNNCFRSMRLKINGNIVYELGSSEFTYSWNTSGYGEGNYSIRLEVAARGDNSWSTPSVRESNYSLLGSGLPKPSLSSPSNGALIPPGTNVTLQWNPVSGASDYLVEIWGGQYGGNHNTPCGWTSNTTCNIGTMSPGNVLWRVKARNSSGTESPWSDEWNFTPQ